MASESEPEKFFGGGLPKGSPEMAKIDIIAVGNDYKILIHFNMGGARMADRFYFLLLFLSFYMRTLLSPPEVFTQVFTSSSADCYAATVSTARCIKIAADVHHIHPVATWARPRPSRMTDSPPYRPSLSVSRSATFVAALLLLADDIAVNPGPRDQLFRLLIS